MNCNFRSEKENDQVIVDKAIELLVELQEANPDIEIVLWISAFLTCIARSFANSDLSFEEFESEMKKATEFYKYKFEKENDSLE